ncbi:hypothetical protein FACS189492_0480 [Clostridia bacterium]|nr:hypothetical protein FACS189492_0480 [Clostridia bacterium]
MANGHGGKRAGSGRPRKPLAEKILEGNPGKRKPKVLDIPSCDDIPLPELPDYLRHLVAAGVDNSIPNTEKIFADTVDFLQGTGCLHLINPQLIHRYVLNTVRWLECEDVVSRVIAFKGHNKDLMPNPMSDQAIRYQKAADTVWAQIWEIVRNNSEVNYGSDSSGDVMEALLNSAWRRD